MWPWLQFVLYIALLLGGTTITAIAIDGLHSLITGEIHLFASVDDLPAHMKDL